MENKKYNQGWAYIFFVFGTLLFMEFLGLGYIDEHWYLGHEEKCLMWAILFYLITYGLQFEKMGKIWFLLLILCWLVLHRYLNLYALIPYEMAADVVTWINIAAILVVIICLFRIIFEKIKLMRQRKNQE